ncbi:MAG: helix-turn-helix transcriptional regulator [Spirochaetales bacterium]|nr:helix-turn-helix transcriptional regulator [Spirochaetales bacterium]
MGKFENIRLDLLIGFSLSGLGLLAFLSNAYSILILKHPESRTLIPVISFAMITLLALPLISVTTLSIKRQYPFRELGQGIQVLIILFFSGLSILDSFESSYGIALFFLAVILAYNYRLVTPFRLVFLALYTVTLTVLGAWRDDRIHASIMSIVFDLFFLFTIGMANRESYKKISRRNETLRLIVKDLKKEITDMEQIESKITALQLDVDEFSLTPAEHEILFVMCEKGVTSNKDLAEHLNKSVSTIKSQIHSIFEKTGIHKRSSLIAFFKE